MEGMEGEKMNERTVPFLATINNSTELEQILSE